MARPSNPTRSGTMLLTLSLVAVLGIPFGLGIYTFSYAEGTSYLSNDPQACLNCHVMREQFDAWAHSSHEAVATCNDCHSPHTFPDNLLVKAVNGWNHSWAFTTGDFPDPIRIREFNAQIVQENCVYCHQPFVSQLYSINHQQEISCVACHGNVGHANRP